MSNKIKLTDFEEHIDPKILERGREYFEDGMVCIIQEIDTDEWTAEVEGTMLYEVKVTLNGEDIESSNCSCPYDWGPVCKHEIAVWYALQEQSTEKRTSKGKHKTVSDKVDEVIKQLSCDKVIELVRDYALEDRKFRSVLFSQLADTGDSDKQNYRFIIKESLNAARDRRGFIDYYKSRHAVRGADELLSRTEKFIENKKYSHAVPVCQVVIEELIPVLQEADDSNGFIGGSIHWAFEMLNRCAEKLRNRKDKNALFDYCIKEADNERFDGWSDWRWGTLNIASELVDNDRHKNILFSKMDEILGNVEKNFIGRYANERAVEVKFNVLQKLENKENVKKFIEDNLCYTPMRKVAINKAFNERDFKRVKELAESGIDQDTRRGFPGLVVKWKKRLLDVAQEENNKQKVIKYSKELFFETSEFEFYEIFKDANPSTKWPDVLENFIKELSSSGNNRANNQSTFGEIFIREKRWGDLLEMVKKNPSEYTLNTYHEYLAKYFPEDIIELSEIVCREKLKRVTGRAHYQSVCRMLKQAKKIGGNDRVKELVKEFRVTYKNRPALIDELSRV